MDKLRTFVAENEGKQQGFQRIVLQYIDEGIPKAQTFTGRWLIPLEEPWVTQEVGYTDRYAVAITAKGNVAVFNFVDPAEADGQFGWGRLSVYPSFLQANAAAYVPSGLIAEAMRRRGVEVQELEI